MNKTSSDSTGFLIGLLTIAFVVLKLTHVISWPWVWVLSPIWISILVGFAIIALVIIIVSVHKLIKGAKK